MASLQDISLDMTETSEQEDPLNSSLETLLPAEEEYVEGVKIKLSAAETKHKESVASLGLPENLYNELTDYVDYYAFFIECNTDNPSCIDYNVFSPLAKFMPLEALYVYGKELERKISNLFQSSGFDDKLKEPLKFLVKANNQVRKSILPSTLLDSAKDKVEKHAKEVMEKDEGNLDKTLNNATPETLREILIVVDSFEKISAYNVVHTQKDCQVAARYQVVSEQLQDVFTQIENNESINLSQLGATLKVSLNSKISNAIMNILQDKKYEPQLEYSREEFERLTLENQSLREENLQLKAQRQQADEVKLLISMLQQQQENFKVTNDSLKGMKDAIQELQRRNKGEDTMSSMPRTFVIKPIAKIEESKGKKQNITKIKNYCRRTVRFISKQFWEQCVLKFFCPILMEEVECGPKNKGYFLTNPTKLLKNSVKVIKIGIFFLRIALATQGLGGVIPNIPFDEMVHTIPINQEYVNYMVQSLSEMSSSDIGELSEDSLDVASEDMTKYLDRLVKSEMKSTNLKEMDPEFDNDLYADLLDVLLEQEKVKGSKSTRLQKSGLIQVRGPDGGYLWISEIASEAFEKWGYDLAKSELMKEPFRSDAKKRYLARKAARERNLKQEADSIPQLSAWTQSEGGWNKRDSLLGK